MIVFVAALWLALNGSRLSTVSEPSPTPSPSTSPQVAGATTAPETPGPSQPSPTPTGTPAPKPSQPVDTAASASIEPPTPAPTATPTPTPQPGLWRVQGYVVDEEGKPLQNVCVVVGPHGCQKYSPHTDERGHYFLDVAATKPGQPTTAFDFYFEMPGRKTVWWHFVPNGPLEFNVVLNRT